MPKSNTFTPGRARANRDLREDMIAALYPGGTVTPGGADSDGDADEDGEISILGRIERTLSRYAGSQQTAFDRGVTRSSASAGASGMQNQVDRALAQVLGRSPGGSADSFTQALASAFPVGADGQVASSPQRSAVQIFSPASAYSTDGFNGLLSSRQATLARQTQLIASDASRILAAIQPFDPRAEAERVEAVRALCTSLVGTVLSEVTRVDEPRGPRVDATLAALDESVETLGEVAYLNNQGLIATADDESRAASWRLLKRYIGMIKLVWNEYKQLEAPGAKRYSLSEILERVTVELPVLARCASNFGDALNSVGYVIDGEGRSRSDLFTALGVSRRFTNESESVETVEDGTHEDSFESRAHIPGLPAMTPFDLSDWVATFASQEAPSYLANSGIYGLTFVGNQTDSLFWTVAPILWKLGDPAFDVYNSGGDRTLFRVLTDERVRWSLDDLLLRLNSVADLVADAEKDPVPPGSKSN